MNQQIPSKFTQVKEVPTQKPKSFKPVWINQNAALASAGKEKATPNDTTSPTHPLPKTAQEATPAANPDSFSYESKQIESQIKSVENLAEAPVFSLPDDSDEEEIMIEEISFDFDEDTVQTQENILSNPETPTVSAGKEPFLFNSTEWVCDCGTNNQGKFCMECGKKKPAPIPEEVSVSNNTDSKEWLCTCGATNVGNFCIQCGLSKKDVNSFFEKAPDFSASEEAVENDFIQPAPEPTPEQSEDVPHTQDVSFLKNMPITKEDLDEFISDEEETSSEKVNYFDEDGNYNPNYDHYYDDRIPEYEEELQKWSIKEHWLVPCIIVGVIIIFCYYFVVLTPYF